MKGKALWLALLTVLALAVLVSGLTGNLPAAQGGAPSAPTVSDASLRLKILNEKLGIPMQQLKTMTPAQIRELYETNAEQLGVNVYKLVKDAQGREQWVAIIGRKPQQQPTPTPKPYPGPSVRSPSQIWQKFLPLVMKGQEDPEIGVIKSRMDQAKAFIDRLYQQDTVFGYVKEYPGCPIWIVNQTEQGYARMVGHYYQNTSQVFGKITWYTAGSQFDLSSVNFDADFVWGWDEPLLTCDRYYQYGTNPPGSLLYQVSKEYWLTGLTDRVDVYIMDTLVIQDVRTKPNGYSVEAVLEATAKFPAHRYTVRHAAQLGRLLYTAYGDSDKTGHLYSLISTYGFGPDIYDPMFFNSAGYADDFMFRRTAYHDCDLVNRGVESTLPFGTSPHRYPYESKVCISPDAYIALSRLDRLAPTLQAIHILTKYDNPDYTYQHPSGTGTTTPRQMAREIEASGWNGYGINAYLKDPAYASGVRTNAFLVLEALLGYGYGDTTSQNYADETYNVLRQVQWGMAPFPTYYGEVADLPFAILRPQFQGGQLLSWRTGGSYVYSLPPRTFINDLIDLMGMPNEVEAYVPANAETTLTYWQALRMYLYYKYAVMYP